MIPKGAQKRLQDVYIHMYHLRSGAVDIAIQTCKVCLQIGWRKFKCCFFSFTALQCCLEVLCASCTYMINSGACYPCILSSQGAC